MKLVCDKEALEYEKDIPMKLDCDIKLSDTISAKAKYNYDFGDLWAASDKMRRKSVI